MQAEMFSFFGTSQRILVSRYTKFKGLCFKPFVSRYINFFGRKMVKVCPLITGFWGPKNPVIRGGRKTRVTSHKKSEFLGRKWPFFGGTIFYTIWVKWAVIRGKWAKIGPFLSPKSGSVF